MAANNLTAGELFGVGAGVSAVNSALGLGGSFVSDWLGDENRKDQAAQDWEIYKKKSDLDWNYYQTAYAPLEQRLQQEMFDYTSAGNLESNKNFYDWSIARQNQSIGERKAALLKAGYNPILAINGGVGIVPGQTVGSAGQVGAVGAPHSAAGVSTSASNPEVRLGGLSLHDILGVLTTAKSLDKMDADIKNVQANTLKTIADTEKPGAVGQAERSLEAIAKQFGDSARDSWQMAIDALKYWLNPPKPKELIYHDPKYWDYDDQKRGVIYHGDLNP